MITAQLQFNDESFDRVLENLLSLPPPLRPTHFGDEEDSVGSKKPIEDKKSFATFIARDRALGFFLFSPGITYDISFRRGKLTCSGDFEAEPSLVKQFLIHMAAAQPIFGFVCAPEERFQRNRVTTKQGVNTIESWVGRDTEKYVPGFYWLTLLPEILAAKHSVSLTVVERLAQEHTTLPGRQHLFRFYDRPEDWRETPVVAELCASLPGIFDVEKVKPQLVAAKNFLELNSMLKDWK